MWILFCRVDFDNLRDIPVLVLDVNDDFKNDEIKQEYLLEKVSIFHPMFFKAHVLDLAQSTFCSQKFYERLNGQ